MKLLLAGYYGSGNLGDEAILQALLSQLRKKYPDAVITVLSQDAEGTSNAYNVASIRKYSLFQILISIRNCDAFILGGGGLLQDVTSARSLCYYSVLLFLAKFFGKKTILLGQGIGPVRNRWILKRALKGIDLVTVRDEMSLKELMVISAKPRKLVKTADLSFLLGAPDREKGRKILDTDGIKRCKPRLIALALRPSIKSRYIENFKAIASACDNLIKEKDCQVVFLTFKYPDDLQIASHVMGLMKYPAHVLLRRCAPMEMLDVVSACDGLIGMRLHSLIFASMAQIPSLGLSYDPKVESFQRSIGAQCLSFDAADEGTLTREFGKFADELKKATLSAEQLEIKARENIALLDECLKNIRINILGVKIDNLISDEAVRKAEMMLSSGIPGMIVTPNPEMIMACRKDIELKDIVNRAQVSVPDGVGLMIAGRMIGKKFKSRIAGIDLMLRLVDLAKEKGYRIFLFGGAEGVAEEAAKNLRANVVGTFQGYSMNDQIVVNKIKEARPDMLFVGLGSPKQEKWASKHLMELNVPLVMCVGGSMDVIAGRVKRAPQFMRYAGIEWLWRLIIEPKRWIRMMVLPAFLVKVIRSR